MLPVDTSQPNPAQAPVASAQVIEAPVTATVETVDNATPATSQTNPTVETSPETKPAATGAGVDDDSGKKKTRYEQRMKEMLTGKPPSADSSAAPIETAPAPAVIDEDEFPSAPLPGQRMPRIKLTPVTPVDVQAMAEFKAAQKAGSGESFIEFVQKRYPAPVAAAAAASEAPTAASASPTVADVDAQRQSLLDEEYALMEAFDFAGAKAKRQEAEKLLETRQQLVMQEAEQAQVHLQQVSTEVEGYLVKAAAMFPQSQKAGDPLVAKATQIMQAWEAAGDPRAAIPAGNLYCYVEAAAELGIAPTASSPAPLNLTSSTPAPVSRAPISAIIASGNASDQSRTPVKLSYDERMKVFLSKKAA